MPGNQAVFIEEGDVKDYLFTSAGKAIDSLQEYLVAVLKGTDVFDRGLSFCGSEIFNRTKERFPAGAVGQIVRNAALRQQAPGGFSITGSLIGAACQYCCNQGQG